MHDKKVVSKKQLIILVGLATLHSSYKNIWLEKLKFYLSTTSLKDTPHDELMSLITELEALDLVIIERDHESNDSNISIYLQLNSDIFLNWTKLTGSKRPLHLDNCYQSMISVISKDHTIESGCIEHSLNCIVKEIETVIA